MTEKKCCTKPLIISIIAIAIFIWAFDFLLHGVALASLYEATASLWRTEAEMQAYWPLCIAFHVAMAALFTTKFFCWRSKEACSTTPETSCCPHKKSMCYGAWVGALLGLPQLMVVIWMPIGWSLPIAWALGELVKWTLAGLLLNKLYSCTKKD